MNATRPLSTPALRRIHAAMEPSRPLPLRSLAEATGLSPSTVARAVAELTAWGILAEDEGTDPLSGRPCRVILPAPVAVLPVLAVSMTHGQAIASDLAAHTLGTASVELDPALPPEEGLRMLCRRAMPLLRGCAAATGLSVCAPILLADRGESYAAEAVTDAVGLPPLMSVGYGEAVAAALPCQPISPKATSLLHIHGGDRRVILLTGQEGEDWRVSPLGRRLSQALARYTDGAECPDALRKRAARFLQELCGFLSPDCILAEDPTGMLPSPEEAALLLPDGTAWIRRETDEGGIPLAALGALILGRRRLWEKILSERTR